MEHVPAGAEIECGRRLGLVEDDRLALRADSQFAVLMDYCIYHHRQSGRTAVDRYRAKNPPDPESDAWIVLDAMGNAYYSLFNVLGVLPEIGVHCFDILRRDPVLIVDVNLGRTAEPNMILASQVMAPEGIAMFTGAMLPVTVDAMDGILRWLEDFDGFDVDQNPARLTAEQEDELAAGIIRACLAGGGGDSIQYKNASQPPPPSPPPQEG